MNLNKQYIVFNYPDLQGLSNNKDGYYSICLEDLYNIEKITVVNYPLEGHNILLRFSHKVFKYLKAKGIFKKICTKVISAFIPYILRLRFKIKIIYVLFLFLMFGIWIICGILKRSIQTAK